LEIFERIDKEIDLGFRGRIGKKAIFNALRVKDTRVLGLFLAQTDNKQVCDEKGRNLLSVAASIGYDPLPIDVFIMLLDAGVQVSTLDNDKKNSIDYALYNCNEEIIRLLLDRGGYLDVNGKLRSRCEDDKFILYRFIRNIPFKDYDFDPDCCYYGRDWSGFDENEADEIKRTEIIKQIELRQERAYFSRWSQPYIDKINFLLGLGMDINVTDRYGCGLLHVMAGLCSFNDDCFEPITIHLLNQGLDMDATTNKGETALIVATITGRINLVKFLLERGANIHSRSNRRNPEGVLVPHFTALEWAKNKLASVVGNENGNGNGNGNGNENEEIIQTFIGIIDVLERYPFTMYVLALKEIVLYHHIDCDTHIDFVQMIGMESDFLG
jgi:ankyrin repeat protein